MLQKEDDYHVV